MSKDHNELNQNIVWHEMTIDEMKSSVSTELASMIDMNILGFITHYSTTSGEL
jgi:hypothetical protein